MRPKLTPLPQSWLDALGARVESARFAIGLTQAELAERVGCSRCMVVYVEQARYQPSSHLLMRLCVALEVSADWLLGMTEKHRRAKQT